MTKRAFALILSVLMSFSLICVPAAATEQKYSNIPILIGYADADYMAEQVLSEIPIPEGGDSVAIIRAVYDWIIRNCDRYSWNGNTYFNEDTLYSEASKYAEETNNLILEGRAIIRPELAQNYDINTWDASYDSNYYIAVFAYDMMMYRAGNCAHYSALLSLLLGHLGYDCRLIAGEFINGDGSQVEHKWNYVLVDGQYYWLDVRMDHAIYDRTGSITYEYFMVTDLDEWEEDHAWDHTYSNGLAADASDIQAIYNNVEHTHDLIYRSSSSPTCTEDGRASHYECTICGKLFQDRKGQQEVSPDAVVRPALGHDWGEWEIISECTFEEDGIRQRVCRNDSTHIETQSFNDLYNPFADVSSSAYYFRPILWALEEGITSGTDATHFSPDTPCTRGQVVTFLWRAAGCPDPDSTSTSFTDVARSAYYYKAVLWAVEQGITSGITSTTFAPDSPCTRAQVVTFLWRYSDSPTYYSGSNPFVDVNYSDYYYSAVKWAVKNGITAGLDATHFGPNDQCTRAQVVTFLYRTCS